MAITTIRVGAEPARPARPSDQHARLTEWHEKTHVMHVAHTKAAARESLQSKWLGVLVAIFTAITGTTMYATWGESPSTLVKVVVGVIAVTGVIAAALQTALSPGKHSAEHKAAGARYGKLRRQMEEWRIEHPADETPDAKTLDEWLKAWVDIETSAPVVSDRELARAEARLRAEHAAPAPW